jgi:hypothetical protein
MDAQDIQKRIEASPALRSVRDKLSEELSFRADASVQFDPFLIVMIISICVQLFIHCRDRKPEDIKQDVRDIRSLPARRLIRLRRRANALWRDCCAEQQYDKNQPNPIMAALYEISETADDAALDELIAMAREQA